MRIPNYVRTTESLGAVLGVNEIKAPVLMERKEDFVVEEKVVISTCGYHCGGKCPLRVHLKGGVIEKITIYDDKEIPPPIKGCVKGFLYPFKVYAPTRLKYPLKRVGKRGQNRFKRITWEEAMDTIAKQVSRIVQTYGPEAIFECAYSGADTCLIHRTMPGSLNPLSRLLNMLGGRTAFANTTSNQGGCFASRYTYGPMESYDGNDRADLVNSKLIILWGRDPTEATWGSASLWYFRQARKAGAKIVVIDPCFTDMARLYAERWIPIRPSTDTAMAVAMAYVMIAENLYDKAFVDKYTYGFDRYKEYVLGRTDDVPKTPQWAEKITGVPASIIIDLAREYAATKPAAIILGFSPGRTAYGEQFHRAGCVLQAMTGNIGIHGGSGICDDFFLWPGIHRVPIADTTLLDSTLRFGGRGVEIKNGRWADAVMLGKAGGYPSDIKMIYVLGHNILVQRQNTKKGIEAMKRPEFIVCHEQFMTNTAKYADIVLPVSTNFEWTEEDIYYTFFGSWLIFAPKKVISPMYGSKSDYMICTELAKRLGFPEKEFNPRTPEEVLRGFFQSLPDITISYEEFKDRGIWKWRVSDPHVAFKEQIEDLEHNPFPTPSGKIEIYSQELANLEFSKTFCSQGDRGEGYVPPLPTYIESEENHPTKKYPLQIANAHSRFRVHSQLFNIPQIMRRHRHEIWINIRDAELRGIKQGNAVRVFNDRGAMIIVAKVTDRIMPGVVRVYQGGWYDPDKEGVDRGGCVNALISDELTSPGGAANYNTCLVEVQKEDEKIDRNGNK